MCTYLISLGPTLLSYVQSPVISNQIINNDTQGNTQHKNQNAFTILPPKSSYLQHHPTNGCSLPSILHFRPLPSSFTLPMASILQFFLSLCLLSLLISSSAASNEIPQVQSHDRNSSLSYCITLHWVAKN